MMRTAFVGSCFCEEFLNHILPDTTLVARHFRINTISLMDPNIMDLGDISTLTPNSRRHLNYENRKDFRTKILDQRPDVLLIDFVRDVRCAVLTDGKSYLSYPYEFFEEAFSRREKVLERLDLIPFGSDVYARLYKAALEEMCHFLNSELPDTRVVILNFAPTWDYRGGIRTKRDFRNDFLCWTLRKPILDSISRCAAAMLHNGTILDYAGPVWSDDDAAYGASAMHYAPGVWKMMAERFDLATFSFHAGEGASHQRCADEMAVAFRYFEDDAPEMDDHWRSLERSGADLLTEIMPAMLHEITYRQGMMRRPTVADAYNAFYWLLGRIPESTETLLAHAAEPTIRSLRRRLLSSLEFELSFDDWTAPDPPIETSTSAIAKARD